MPGTVGVATLMVALALLALLHNSMAQVQNPRLSFCNVTTPRRVVLRGISVRGAMVGGTLQVSYGMQVYQPLTADPIMKVTVSNSAGVPYGCYFGVGSCSYRLCGGTHDMEMQLAKPWSNRCPIRPRTYRGTFQLALPPFIGYFVRDGRLRIQLQGIQQGKVFGCQAFTLRLTSNK
ncbi:uncharacterized protein LOC8042376 [Ixodes scapularis]|nr:uncharacterized protein LOC8042376 [Ixodes scapularis]